jgi:hypothetical protein
MSETNQNKADSKERRVVSSLQSTKRGKAQSTTGVTQVFAPMVV